MSEGEPFRDGMNAALMRIDQLSGENAELRDELIRLRTTAGDTKTQSTDHHANALADQTLALLDRLDVKMREVVPELNAHTFRTAEELEAHADTSLLGPGPTQGSALAPTVVDRRQLKKAAKASRDRWTLACLACLFIGVIIGRLWH